MTVFMKCTERNLFSPGGGEWWSGDDAMLHNFSGVKNTVTYVVIWGRSGQKLSLKYYLIKKIAKRCHGDVIIIFLMYTSARNRKKSNTIAGLGHPSSGLDDRLRLRVTVVKPVLSSKQGSRDMVTSRRYAPLYHPRRSSCSQSSDSEWTQTNNLSAVALVTSHRPRLWCLRCLTDVNRSRDALGTVNIAGKNNTNLLVCENASLGRRLMF